MSALDLRSVLADPAYSGAYIVADADAAAMAAAGAALGYRVVHIDLAGCVDRADLFARFAAALGFPPWFGHNWDALADALGDLSWLPADGYLLLIEQAQAWRAGAGDDVHSLVDILDDAGRAWAGAGVAFWALLPLPAADVDALG